MCVCRELYWVHWQVRSAVVQSLWDQPSCKGREAGISLLLRWWGGQWFVSWHVGDAVCEFNLVAENS